MNDKLLQVKVVMVTYNQEKYIAQAIESVIMQKTNFVYRLIIGDDYSTDSTTDICEQYAEKNPDMITLICNSKNMGLLANYKQILENYQAKYIAILEGDDYWTDENKLQAEFDLLESNPNIGLVHTDCDLLFESGKLQKGSHHHYVNSFKNGNDFKQLLEDNYIRPVTVMFRQEIYDKFVPIDEYIQLGFITLDSPMWLDIARNTTFSYLYNSTAVYRIHNSSLSNNSQYEKMAKFFKSIYDIRVYIFSKYCLDIKLQRKVLNKYMIERLAIEMEHKEYNNVNELSQRIKIIDIKSFLICQIAAYRPMINLYSQYLKLRKEK